MKAPAQSPMRRPAFLTLILFPLSMIRWLLQGIVVSKHYRNLILRLVRRSGEPLPPTQWPPSSPSVVQLILTRPWLASEPIERASSRERECDYVKTYGVCG